MTRTRSDRVSCRGSLPVGRSPVDEMNSRVGRVREVRQVDVRSIVEGHVPLHEAALRTNPCFRSADLDADTSDADREFDG